MISVDRRPGVFLQPRERAAVGVNSELLSDRGSLMNQGPSSFSRQAITVSSIGFVQPAGTTGNDQKLSTDRPRKLSPTIAPWEFGARGWCEVTVKTQRLARRHDASTSPSPAPLVEYEQLFGRPW